MFRAEEIARYASQIILPQIGAAGQDAFKNAKILLVGCGGLGSACSLYLVASGIGNITLVDDDKVELANLQRQILYNTNDIGQPKINIAAKTLQKHNPHTKITTVAKRFNFCSAAESEDVVDYNLIIDCSDNIQTKKAVNRWSLAHKITAIFAGAVGWNGFFFSLKPYQTACYECLYAKNNLSTPCDEVGIVGPLVGIIGCLQALTVLKILLAKDECNFGEMFFFDGLNFRNYSIKLQKRVNCPACCS